MKEARLAECQPAGIQTEARVRQDRPTRRTQAILLGAVAVLLLAASWYALMQHNWARVESLCWTGAGGSLDQRQLQEWNPECVTKLFLGADTIEYWYYFRDYPRTFNELGATGSFRDFVARVGGEYEKRPLYGPLSAALNISLSEATASRFPDRMFMILGLYASCAVVLLFYLLRLIGLRFINAVLLAAVAAVSFGWLSIFSIPESYSLAVVGLMLSLISGYQLLIAPSDTRWPRILIHCVVTAIAAWLYLPSGGAVLFFLARGGPPIRRLLALASCVCLVCILTLAPQVLYNGFGNILAQFNYGQRWGDPGNLIDVSIWTKVLVSILFFGVVSPLGDFMRSPGGVDWLGFLARPGAVVLTCCLCGLYLIVLRVIIRSNARRAVSGPAVWLMLIVAWNVYFNPSEVLLYLSVPLGVLAYIVGVGAREIEKTRAGAVIVTGSLSLIFLALLVSNWRTVFGAPS